jgi:hypothetical protein
MPPVIIYKPGYKYQLEEDYAIQLPKELWPDSLLDIYDTYFILGIDGTLTIKAGYAWDGPSGPTFDTKNFMRGSLVHDVLYQAMKTGYLPATCRKAADELLRQICLEDGMSSVRAWWVYQGVRFGGGNYVTTPEKPALSAP